MGSASDRPNPRRWAREARLAHLRALEEKRWNSLTEEEQQQELRKKEQDKQRWIEDRKQAEIKEALQLEKYMKNASDITIDDFFKSSLTYKAKVIAFCTIRGYSERDIRLMLFRVENLLKSTRKRWGHSRESAVDITKLYIKNLFVSR